MPSTVTFLIHSHSNSSVENNNNMLEHSLDDSNNQRSALVTRQIVSFDDDDDDNDHRIKINKFSKSDNQGEAILLETEEDQQQIFSQEKQKSIPKDDLFSPDELEINTENLPPASKSNHKQPRSSSSPSRTRTNITSTHSMNNETRRPISKIPIRSNSSSHSPTLTRNKRQISSPKFDQGAFRFFTPQEQQKDNRKRLASTDDDDIETNHLKEEDLILKLKQEKKHGKKTGELLTKLHENYEELLEKYAQAENTIDQLRFQPKIFGDNTPRSTASEHLVNLTQQSKVNVAALRSSGVYRSMTGSPFSSIRPVPSTTTTTPARKSISPTNSGTLESIFFDEVIPETLKFDLLNETKTLGEKMKTFLTLINENQLSLAEQKQVYDNIKQDYEKLLKDFDQNKHNGDIDIDLNKELENMKQLLKEIVKKITQNLLGKSIIDSSLDRQTNDNSQSSELSIRSSLCNHNDLMDQYKKLLNAVNTRKPSIDNQLPMNTKIDQQSIKTKQKPYVYVSGDSDDEQQDNDGITPIPYTKGVESTSVEFDYIPSTSIKHHQQHFQSKRKQKEIRNRTNDYDSGIGTNNLTKLSHDSKLYTNTMDESHFQSLDDEQDSISSSSRSSGSGSASPRSPYSKKFDKRSIHREKPIGHSNSYLSDIDSRITGSFDILPQTSYKKKHMHRSSHTWRPQKKTSIPYHSRLPPIYRSTSIGTPSIEDYKKRSFRPSTTPQISSKIKNTYPLKPPPTYKSSIYINQTHTNKQSVDKTDRNLYLDPQTGIVYRYESEKTSNPPRIYYEPTSSTKLYRCTECGTVTSYHHRHHIGSTLKQVTTNSDDLGYESGHNKRNRRYRYTGYSSSSSSDSDSESDVIPNYLEMLALNQAYNRAETIRYQSRCLSRYIVRQLKLSLATL